MSFFFCNCIVITDLLLAGILIAVVNLFDPRRSSGQQKISVTFSPDESVTLFGTARDALGRIAIDADEVRVISAIAVVTVAVVLNHRVTF